VHWWCSDENWLVKFIYGQALKPFQDPWSTRQTSSQLFKNPSLQIFIAPYVGGNTPTAPGLVPATEGLGTTQRQRQHVCGLSPEPVGTLTVAVDFGLELVDGCTCVRCLQSVGAEFSAWGIWSAAGVRGMECVTKPAACTHLAVLLAVVSVIKAIRQSKSTWRDAIGMASAGRPAVKRLTVSKMSAHSSSIPDMRANK
jgi:hypothetical protein